MLIRDFEERDLDMAAALEKEIFSMPWSREALTDAIRSGKGIYAAAEDDEERLAGYCGLYLILDEGYINQVAVRSDLRRCGIGKRMMEHLLRRAREKGMKDCSLEVRASNEAAIKLYESLGFKSEGIRPGFYDAPKEDALIMWQRI